jgi:hypothetical protein
MVAILVMSIGILGLVSTAAVVTRQMGSAGRMAEAASVAQARFEEMRGARCEDLVSGDTTLAHGVQESWVATDTTRAVIVLDTVKVAAERGDTLTQVYRSLIPCPSNP